MLDLIWCRERRRYGRGGLHPADGGDFRPAGLGAKAGRTTVSYDNAIGLALAALLALYLAAALLFPERF
jgi:K+-transporting ATPase KdpF subunit